MCLQRGGKGKRQSTGSQQYHNSRLHCYMVSETKKLVKLRLPLVLKISMPATGATCHWLNQLRYHCTHVLAEVAHLCMTRLTLFPGMQVRTECGVQLAEQDNFQLLPLPMDSVGCTRDCGSGILHSGILSGSQEGLLSKGMFTPGRAAHCSIACSNPIAHKLTCNQCIC